MYLAINTVSVLLKPVLYREMIPFCSEAHAKLINILFEQNVDFLNFKLDGPFMLSFEGFIFSRWLYLTAHLVGGAFKVHLTVVS